jgi:hypothetical protein
VEDEVDHTLDWNRARVLMALLVLQAVLFGSVFASSARDDSAMPATESTSSFDFSTPDTALTLMTGKERADQVAAKWDPDARLVYASMQIDWSSAPPPATTTSISPFGWLRFVYVTEIHGGRTDQATLSLLFERVSGQLINQTVNQWSEPFLESELFANVSTTDSTAVLGTELGGGTAFRSECPKIRNRSMVSLVVDQTSGEPAWIISYPGENGDLVTGMGFNVNAASGAVTITRQPPASCPADS